MKLPFSAKSVARIALLFVCTGLSTCKDPAPSSRALVSSGDVQGTSNGTGCLTRTALTSATSWNGGIGTIFQNNCTGCHPGVRTSNYITYAGVKGNLNEIATKIQSGEMPKNKTLSQDDKIAIITWMSAGAPETDSGVVATPAPGSTIDPCQQAAATPFPTEVPVLTTSPWAQPTPN